LSREKNCFANADKIDKIDANILVPVESWNEYILLPVESWKI